jgi:hypothetical protein
VFSRWALGPLLGHDSIEITQNSILKHIGIYSFFFLPVLYYILLVNCCSPCISDSANKSTVPVPCMPYMVPICDINILPCQLVSLTWYFRFIYFPFHRLVGHISCSMNPRRWVRLVDILHFVHVLLF